MAIDEPWVEKYRPRRLKDYICDDPGKKKKYKGWVKEGKLPGNLLLHGPPGCGKTTLARVLVREFKVDLADFMFINASRENGIDMIRDKIKAFSETMAWGDTFRVILLDEADSITRDGQNALRADMERSSHIRFILTCNHEHRISDAIKSRCRQIHVGRPDHGVIVERIMAILDENDVEYEAEQIVKFLDAAGGDLRQVIGSLEENVRDGKLHDPDTAAGGNLDWVKKAVGLFKGGKFQEARKLVCSKAAPSDYEGIYTHLYRNLQFFGKSGDEMDEAILVIRDGMVKHTQIADPELNFAATMVKLSMIGGKKG